MAAYLVTYDLHDPDQSNNVLRHLRSLGAIKVTDSSYVLCATKTATMIVEELESAAGGKITAYAFTIGGAFKGNGDQSVEVKILEKLLN